MFKNRKRIKELESKILKLEEVSNILEKKVNVANKKLDELQLVVKIDEKVKRSNVTRKWLNGEYEEGEE